MAYSILISSVLWAERKLQYYMRLSVVIFLRDEYYSAKNM